MYSETHSCSNCGGETENEPMTLCDECMEDTTTEREPFAWWLVGGTEIFLASEFTPDTEHLGEWCPLYR